MQPGRAGKSPQVLGAPSASVPSDVPGPVASTSTFISLKERRGIEPRRPLSGGLRDWKPAFDGVLKIFAVCHFRIQNKKEMVSGSIGHLVKLLSFP